MGGFEDEEDEEGDDEGKGEESGVVIVPEFDG